MKKKGKKGKGVYRALLSLAVLALVSSGGCDARAAGGQTNLSFIKFGFDYPSAMLTNQSPYDVVTTNAVGDFVTNTVPGMVVTGFNVYRTLILTPTTTFPQDWSLQTTIPSSMSSNTYVFNVVQIPGKMFYTLTAVATNYWGVIESVPSKAVASPASIAPAPPSGAVLKP